MDAVAVFQASRACFVGPKLAGGWFVTRGRFHLSCLFLRGTIDRPRHIMSLLMLWHRERVPAFLPGQHILHRDAEVTRPAGNREAYGAPIHRGLRPEWQQAFCRTPVIRSTRRAADTRPTKILLTMLTTTILKCLRGSAQAAIAYDERPADVRRSFVNILRVNAAGTHHKHLPNCSGCWLIDDLRFKNVISLPL